MKHQHAIGCANVKINNACTTTQTIHMAYCPFKEETQTALFKDPVRTAL
jgi:hypothetical protein